jgi:hypothetical protein
VKERKIEDVPEAIQNLENEKITTYLKKPNVRVRESSTAFGKGKDANGKGQGVRLSLEYRVGQLYYNLGKVFSFPNEMTQKVFTAMWLVKNGSLVLKGPPGTGKTTLTETSTYLLCNNIDYEKSNEQYESWSENVEGMFVTKPYTGETEYSLRDIDFFIKSEFGTVGIAKHNPDKTPDEILYKTQIVLDKIMFDSTRTNPPEITRKHIGWVPGLKIDDTFKNNPASVTSGKFVERQEYNFIPMPRNIVTSPIKFHNECSRMSSVVADAVLGLMSEGQVEHLGSVFESPSEGIGSISIYDLNPHLEKMDRGLDWAFNDRIDVEIWLPSGKLYDYWQVMKKRVNIEPIISESKREKEMGKKIEGKETVLSRTTVGDPRAIVAGLMNYTVPWFPSKLPWVDNNTVGYKFIEPLTYDELQILWKRIESTKINEGLLVRVAAVMRLFSVSWYRYPESVYKQTNLNEYLKKNGIGYEFIDGHKEKDNPNAFIDTSYATVQYSQSGNKTKSASVEMSDSSAKQTAESYLSYASNPLGMRAIISLIQVARAIKFLETAIKTYDNKKGFEFTDMEKMKMTIDEDKDDSDYFWSLIPFVVSHRIHGTRIHPSIYDNYLNVQDWVENIIEPFRKTHFKLWDAMIKSIEETLDVGAQPQVIPLFDQNQNVAILRFADIQMKCPECGGDGKIKGSGSPKVEVTCGRCKGSGEIPFEYPTSKKSVEKITPRDVGEAYIEYFNHKFWKTFESRASKTKDDYFVSSGKAASIRSTDPILYEISCMFQNLQNLNKIKLDDADRVRDIPNKNTEPITALKDAKAETKKK